MQTKAFFSQETQQKHKKSQSSPIIQKQLLEIYQNRMRSLIEVIKVYQQNYQKDNSDGALSFMQTQQFGLYRIDRQVQLLKDTLLLEKQKLVIKLKKQNEYLHKLTVDYKSSLNKKNQENIAEKDIKSPNQVEKRILSKNKITNSNSRVSLSSNISNNESGIMSNTTVYQKLLQQKLILIKDLQKKNKQLNQMNQVNTGKLKQLQERLKLSLEQSAKQKCLIDQKTLQNQKLNKLIEPKQCQQCKKLSQTINLKSKQLQTKNIVQQNLLLKIKEKQLLINLKQQEIKRNQYRIKQVTHEKQKKQKQLEQTIKNNKQKQIERQLNSKKQKKIDHSNTIKQLKNQIITLQQQMMVVINSFNLIKQDLSESLASQIKKLKNSHQILKQNIKSHLTNIKTQMMQMVLDIVDSIKLKIQSNRNKNQFIKKLKNLDNQIDFFLESKQIHA